MHVHVADVLDIVLSSLCGKLPTFARLLSTAASHTGPAPEHPVDVEGHVIWLFAAP